MEAAPNEGDWTGGMIILESHFDLAVNAGFDSIRIPVGFSLHALTNAPFTIDEMFMQRVEQVVTWGLSRNLKIVIDMHNYAEINNNPSGQRQRFVEMWKQIAGRFKNYPDALYFELLNEPSMAVDVWNDIVSQCLKEIRKIDNHHTIVVGCTSWSAVSGLSGLKIPAEESNVIVTFHYYNPSLFCFQGQPWIGPDFATTNIVWPGPPAQSLTPAAGVSQWARDWINQYNTVQDSEQNPAGSAIIRNEINYAAQWGIVYHRPLWMSEFTAQDRADMTSRSNWIAFVRTQLESHNISWSYWTLFSDQVIYDSSNQWTLPLTGALGLNVSN